MVAVRIGKFVGVVGVLGVFGGCQMVGPIAIDAGRDRYNSIIQSTSKQQAFSNIIRVHNNEPTSFMDVTEVDATQSFAGTVNGAVTNIGAKLGTTGGTLAGEVGSITPGVTYSETPLIRYVPLVGQGLVEQLVAPINTDALASLSDSEWSLMPLLDLSADFLTLDYDEFGAVINTMAELDYDERLELVSTKSDWTKPKNPPASSSDNTTGGANKKTSTSASTDDALVVYFSPFHPHTRRPTDIVRRQRDADNRLWSYLLALYDGTRAKSCGSKKIPDQGRAGRDGAKSAAGDAANADVKKAVAQGAAAAAAAAAADAAAKATAAAAEQVAKKASDEANGSAALAAPAAAAAAPKTQQAAMPQNCAAGNSIELRNAPVTKTPNPFISAAPLMRTYSALGVLRNAAQPPYPKIGFVHADKYQRITNYWWNDPHHMNALLSVYTLRPMDPEDSDEKTVTWKQQEKEDKETDAKLDKWLDDSTAKSEEIGRLPYVYTADYMSEDDFVKVNQRLEELRRYILIIDSDAAPPADAYVTYFDRGHWYYIDGHDVISQKNFNLIVLFLTVMAYPPTTAPLNTSISVGGG